MAEATQSKATTTLPLNWTKKAEHSLLSEFLPVFSQDPKPSEYAGKIEILARQTNDRGSQPLWSGYGSNNIAGPERTPNQVRTPALLGSLYTQLVQRRKPSAIVEFGTAFGVSGMYFLAGINSNDHGHLFSFEPNEVWGNIAARNLSQIDRRFTLTLGIFEENIDLVLPSGITVDLAFIDAIHTSEFVLPQLDLVVARCSPGAIIILDDINFSEDMQRCWQTVAADARFISSAAVAFRVGFLELA